MLIGLLSITACSKEEEVFIPSSTPDKLSFTGTLQQESIQSTKVGDDVPADVLDDSHGTITIHQLGASAPKDTAYYEVRSGYWGTLDSIVGSKPLDWSNKKNDVTFHAWTNPEGVALTSSKVDEGTVDFEADNQALEHLIGAQVVANYEKSHTVTLPFKHLVGKITIDLRDQYNKEISNAQFTFLNINKTSDFTTKEGIGPKVTRKDANNEALVLPYTRNESMYLPSISFQKDGDGDFRIAVGNENFFGTLNELKIATEKDGVTTYASLDSLRAGHHLKLKMILTKGHGVGIGCTILNWEYKDPDEIIGSNYKGIFSAEDLLILADSINTYGKIPAAYLYSEKTVRLYKNIDLNGVNLTSIGTKDNPFTGTFDGQGYTISGLTGATGLFGTVGNADASSATIRNLRLSGTIAGTADGIALLIDTATNTTVKNCHVIGTSSVSNTGATAGGLIGIAKAGTTVSQCSFTGTISGSTIGGIVGSFAGSEISNCFVSESGTAIAPINIAGSNTAGTIKNCYSVIKKVSSGDNEEVGYYWSSKSNDIIYEATFNQKGTFLSPISSWSWTTLLEALNANSGSVPGISWVYVYGKDFPVMRIK